MQAETLLPVEKSPAQHAAAMPGWRLKTALGQGPGNPRAPFDSALREPASPAPAGQIQTKHGHRWRFDRWTDLWAFLTSAEPGAGVVGEVTSLCARARSVPFSPHCRGGRPPGHWWGGPGFPGPSPRSQAWPQLPRVVLWWRGPGPLKRRFRDRDPDQENVPIFEEAVPSSDPHSTRTPIHEKTAPAALVRFRR